jgi:hypothetical protein
MGEWLMVVFARPSRSFLKQLHAGARVQAHALYRKAIFPRYCKNLVLTVAGVERDKRHGTAGLLPTDRAVVVLMVSGNPDVVVAINPASGMTQSPVIWLGAQGRSAITPEK